jgi:polyferredoxin
MDKFRRILKFLLWLFVTVIFVVDFIKIILDLSSVSGSVHQRFLTTIFRSSFFVFELIMGGLIIYFMVKRPQARLRLLSLAVFHYASVLVLPLAFRDFTWMAVLYPWPQTLLAFDPKTTAMVSLLSLVVGFAAIPALTLLWGAKGFCGYVCPHGAFYSEAYGRLFTPPPGRLDGLKKYFPPLYFLAMSIALALILAVPAALEPVRNTQKVAFFLTSQMFYLIIGAPLVGPRSYCTHFCPIGYEIKYLVKLKHVFSPGRNNI